MDLNLFINSKIIKSSVLEINAKKLSNVSDGAELKVTIGIGLEFDDTKTDLGYEIIFNLSIKCEEDGEEKHFSLKYKAKAIYEFKSATKNIEESFKKEYNYFFRESYNLNREYLNNELFKMKVNFQLPLNLPDDLKNNIKISD